MLRRTEFQTGLYQLRQRYQEWIKGPPVTHFTLNEDSKRGELQRIDYHKIKRKDVSLYEHDCCDEDDPMVGAASGAWAHFNSKWGIQLPKDALSKEMPDLSPFTMDEWEPLGQVGGTVMPPAVTSEFYKRGLNRLTLTVDLEYPRDVLLARIDKELKRATDKLHKAKRKSSLSPKRKRRRHDKLTFQLRVYDLSMKGEPPWQIARVLERPLGTVRSALAIAVKLIRGERPRFGKLWERDHIKNCSECRREGMLDLNCPVARRYENGKIEAEDARLKERDTYFLPPLPVQGEKSAFAKWDAKARDWYRYSE